jgi:hypothetical protein
MNNLNKKNFYLVVLIVLIIIILLNFQLLGQTKEISINGCDFF